MATTTGISETSGRTALVAWLSTGHSQVELAGKLGLHQSSVSLWVAGRARPEHHHRIALRRVCAIPERAWLTPEELAIATGSG